MLILQEFRSILSLFMSLFRRRFRGEPVVSRSRSGSGAMHPAGMMVIDPSEFGLLLEHGHRFPDGPVELTFIIADFPLIAAPLVMFFLKRQGFSRCKAWKEPSGLAVSALR